MKKLFVFAFTLILLSFSQNLFAQRRGYSSSASSDSPQNLIKINPLSLFTTTGSVFYEHVLSENTSMVLNLQYTLPRKASIFGTDILGENGKLNRFAVAPEFRYYPSGTAPTGFYVGPFARYVNFSAKGDITKEINGEQRTIHGKLTQQTFSLGCVIGGQWLFGDHISLDAYIGPYFSLGHLSVTQDLTEDDYNVPASINFPVWFRTGLTVGYAF
ncbi:DUF3575 domain-containing protein [Cytophagaceae bacterium YF14B1]|uniref:DUF3575 domain-containing protein n=1 Tax=Xanthocytophaga flava TaxID=3048013 RepID=A0AAE3QM38_9BACT|nr:DUF3575 domain-containing protein [Xanthocytophaga flavus]MDJ1479441.1 DUF3575 domain-containing protein [Xanthocytophaga flavus]